jgi:hypothetical protein
VREVSVVVGVPTAAAVSDTRDYVDERGERRFCSFTDGLRLARSPAVPQLLFDGPAGRLGGLDLLRRLDLDLEQHPATGEYELTAEAVAAMRAESERMRALHARPMKPASAPAQHGPSLDETGYGGRPARPGREHRRVDGQARRDSTSIPRPTAAAPVSSPGRP